MSEPITFDTPKTVICHGGGGLHLLDYVPGTKIWTGQPTVDAFDTPLEAIERFVALGGALDDTKHLWPEGQAVAEQDGALAWVPV